MLVVSKLNTKAPKRHSMGNHVSQSYHPLCIMDRGVAEVKLCCKTNIPSYLHQSAFRAVRVRSTLDTLNYGVNPRPVRRNIQQSRSTVVCQVFLLADDLFFGVCVGDHVISK
jgi:hypothetical protein